MLAVTALIISLLTPLSLIIYHKQFSPHARHKKAKKRLKQMPLMERDSTALKQQYPDYVIGTGSYGVPTVRDFGDDATLRIGAYTSIAEGVLILLSSGHHRPDWITTYPFPDRVSTASHLSTGEKTSGDVTIGSDVWICSNVTILPGLTVGDGAVLAAHAVVTRDVPPYAVVAGNPARVINWRFDETTRARLLESQWWNWPEDEIASVAERLCSTDTESFFDYVASRRTRTE